MERLGKMDVGEERFLSQKQSRVQNGREQTAVANRNRPQRMQKSRGTNREMLKKKRGSAKHKAVRKCENVEGRNVPGFTHGKTTRYP